MRIAKAALVLALSGLVAQGIVGCGRKGEVSIKGNRKAEVLAIAEPIIDSLMASYNSGDYDTYIKDFSERLRADVTRATFDETRQLIMDRVGRYVQRKSPEIRARGQNVILTCRADFEQEKNVELRVVFHAAGEKFRIANIRFNSPRLQDKS
jgi:hypothetical protein